VSIMPLNTAENGPAVPLGEPPDARPVGLAEASEQWLSQIRRAVRADGVQPDEMQIIAATFQAVKMEIRAAIARQSAGGAGVPGAPAVPGQQGPSTETQDYGTAQGAEPMEA